MQEYSRKKVNNNSAQNAVNNIAATGGSIPNSAFADILSGSKRPDSKVMGHRTDLAPSIEAKMSKAFGMDFSALKLYRSDAFTKAGAKGVASGNSVVLSTDINLNTQEGQAILGHELSHIHAQSEGIGLGNSGLYHNAALEEKADTEGLMAARGLNVYGDTSSMSETIGMKSFDSLTPIGPGMSATAGAPMQAWEKPSTKRKRAKAKMDSFQWTTFEDDAPYIEGNGKDKDGEVVTEYEKRGLKRFKAGSNEFSDRFYAEHPELDSRNNNSVKTNVSLIVNGKAKEVGGFNWTRILPYINTSIFEGMSYEDKEEMILNLANNTDNEKTLKGIHTFRNIMFKKFKNLEKRYGRMPTRMNTDLFASKVGASQQTLDSALIQDADQLVQDGNGKEVNDMIKQGMSDEEYDYYKRLNDYYGAALRSPRDYALAHIPGKGYMPEMTTMYTDIAREHENGVKDIDLFTDEDYQYLNPKKKKETGLNKKGSLFRKKK